MLFKSKQRRVLKVAELTKVYTYTRVSTAMQVDGYSLDAQKERVRKYCEANDFKIVGTYEDAGISGKSIENRLEFKMMLDDIVSQKDDVKYVVVFKLSRFGRNASDILNSLQTMQAYGCNLIAIDEGINSGTDTGKLVMTILSAVSEIERENIRVHTMEGRRQKAREGKWNGGFAPYGYALDNGMLVINEDEAEDIRRIFDLYVNSSMGANGIAKGLHDQGIQKKPRKNGGKPYFTADLIRKIISNPVYNGKIRYGYRAKEMVKGKPNQSRQVIQDDYLLSEGIHEAIVNDDVWQKAQEKRKKQSKRYERTNKIEGQRIHLLSGILKCPVCGAGMYGNKSSRRKSDGTKYKDHFYYQCKHRNRTRGEERCDFKKQLNQEKLDAAIAEIVTKLVSNPNFAKVMQDNIKLKTDTNEIDSEIEKYRKTYGKYIGTKRSLEEQIDSLDVDDMHYEKKLSDFNMRLNKMYDNIFEIEKSLKELQERKRIILEDKLTFDNVYKVLIHFDKLYNVMERSDKRKLLFELIQEIHIHEEAKSNGQWLKSIVFKLPLISEDMSSICLDTGEHVETVVLLSRK